MDYTDISMSNCTVPILTLSHSQSQPQGHVPLTSPKLEKLELNTLQTHLPRYTSSGMSSTEVQWWKAYISMLQDSSSTGHNDQWVLQILEHLQTFAHCHSQTPSLPPILEDLSQIVSSERQDIPAMYIGNQRRQQAQQ